MSRNINTLVPGTFREAATRAIKKPGTITLPSDLT
jgi:hypothetical protein